MSQEVSQFNEPRMNRGGRNGGRGRGRFSSAGRGRGRGGVQGSDGYMPPSFRKTDDETAYVLEQNVPGYTKDDLKLRVINHPRLLELSMVNPPTGSTDTSTQDQTPPVATRRPIFRRWRLPVDGDVSLIEASITDGVFKARVGITDPISFDTPLVIH
jgi:HSP20 family molecular chaperone IbpA